MSSVRPRPFRFTVQASRLGHPDELRPLARKAEDMGISALTVADHLDDQLAPIAALMAVADATTTLRIGSLVFANDYRHPVVLAKEAATVDVLSGGRLEFGLGAGWMAEDYHAAGIPMDRPGVRIARLEEALEIITGLWSDGPVEFAGEHYTVSDLEGQPKPAQRPRPPIMIGGGGPRVLALAGRWADIVGLNPSLTAGVIDEHAGPSATAEATEEKLRIIRDAAGDRFNSIELQTRIHLAIVTDDRQSMFDLFAGGFGLTSDQARNSPHALCGTVEQIVDDLVERRERFGISTIGLSASALDDMAPVIDRLAGT
jgi:probable F420-dependent oxidoreductase